MLSWILQSHSCRSGNRITVGYWSKIHAHICETGQRGVSMRAAQALPDSTILPGRLMERSRCGFGLAYCKVTNAAIYFFQNGV